MFFIIANILRIVVMAFVTALPLTALQQFFDGTIKELVEAIKSEHGLDTEEAKDILVNILVETAVNATVVGVIIKTKIAVKSAEFLGLTSKGFKTRTLTPKATVAVKQMMGPWEKFKMMGLVSKIIIIGGLAGAATWMLIGIANVIEPGIYQPKRANDVWESFTGKRPFPEPSVILQPGPFDSKQFMDYTSALERAGILGLNNPVAKQSQVYSRKSLAEIIDYVYGKEVMKGNAPSAKQLIPLLAQYLISDTEKSVSTPQKASAIYTAPQVPQVHVFSGVVSSGVIGSTASFTPRQDDLIENAAELTTASHNNLAPFIAALPARMSYEIKIVPSIKSASGFTQRGTAQRVVSGYNKDGSAKYRTVVNKFAVMDIFVKTDKGTQSKITTIVLGPVDSVRFQAANVDMTGVASSVQQNIVAPASVATPTATPAMVPIVPIPAKGVFQSKNPPFFGTLYKIVGGSRVSWSPWPELYNQTEREQLNQDPNKFAQNEQKLKDLGVITSDIVIVPFIADRQPGETQPERGASSFTEFFGMAPSAGVVAPVVTPVAAQATTLFEYYQAHGQSLPSVEERSKLYEQLALGQAAYYTGTAEQNTKLLAALQGARL